jgi:uncharacterized protein (TIGR00297 family)
MNASPQFSEERRQLVHIAVGSFALLLRVIGWWEAVILAGTAIAFNVYALPRIAGPWLHRPAEGARRYVSGIALYPVAILLLLLTFSDRLDIVAAAWGILAVGDGMATLVGRHVNGPRIPWNRDKSLAGSAAFCVCGGSAAAFLCWWCRPVVIPPPYLWFSIAAPFLAALAAAAVETIPITLDDNLSVPASAAAVLWGASLVSADLAASAASAAVSALPVAIAVNLIVAAIGYRARTVSVSGSLCGGVLGIIVMLATGWAGWLLLVATFGAAVITSRLGWERKTILGIAEARGGRRGAGNAIANTGVAAAAALLSALTYAHDLALVALVAALTAGGSDTIASEIGKAWGRRTYLLTTLRPVAPGTSGAISLEGTAAGLIGALALGAVGVWVGLVPAGALVPVVAGATIGSLAEGVMGATLEGPGIVNNDVLNFLNTTIAALTAVVLVTGLE